MNEPNNQQSEIIVRETYDTIPAEAQKETSQASVAPRSKGDPYIWGIYITLLIVSVIELFSASSMEVKAGNVYAPLIRHTAQLIIGLCIVLTFQKVHYRKFRDAAYIFAFFALGLIIFSSFFGININGAQRAIRLPGFTLQPAEIAKLAVIMTLATILAKNQMPRGVTNAGVIKSAALVLVFSAFLYRNGLTNTALIMGVSWCMFILSGIQGKKLVTVFVVYVSVFAMIYYIHQNAEGGREETRSNRIERWIDGVHPDSPINDNNRQVIFSNIAQANGGLTGNGPGNSRESARLPLAFSDYIYSIIVEDTGLIGGVLLMLFYFFLLFRAGVIARKCSRAFPAFLIIGCAMMIVFQALAHMWIVVIGPVSGQPLPLISKGGTSIIVMSAAIGMMLSVSRYAVTSGNKKEINSEIKELPEDIQSANPSYIDPSKN